MRFVVTGTDTGIGKTVFSAALAGALDANYWKPVQAGLAEETDSECVRRLSGLPEARIFPEAYRLRLPASPHISAAHEGIKIEAGRLTIPQSPRLIVEGAGGLLVPLSAELLQADLFASWGLPLILCARTALGTINHTLLSLEALAKRRMKVQGVVFIGEPEKEVEDTIIALGRTRRLGRIPIISPLNRAGLAEAFRTNFSLSDFTERF